MESIILNFTIPEADGITSGIQVSSFFHSSGHADDAQAP